MWPVQRRRELEPFQSPVEWDWWRVAGVRAYVSLAGHVNKKNRSPWWGAVR